MKSDIMHLVSKMCVNSGTGKPFPISQISKAMAEAKVNVQPSKSAKKQALDVIKMLEKILPLERAKMRLRLPTGGEETVEAL